MRSIKGQPLGNHAIHFHLFALQEVYQSEFQQKIAVNILHDLFRREEGVIYQCRDGDIILLYHGQNNIILKKAIHQLRFLFEDDPLAYNADGSENEDFCSEYDLGIEWRPFYRMCSERKEFSSQVPIKPQIIEIEEREDLLTAGRLSELMPRVNELDFNLVIRKQPICAFKPKKKASVVFHEMYVNIAHLTKLLKTPCNLTSNKWLFGYLSEALDRKVLDIISDRPKAYISKPISLNLNVSTIFSPEFEEFCGILNVVTKTPIVVEIQISDVFDDMNAFRAAQDIIKNKGFRICLDGLGTRSFSQISREGLGFDLAKVRWNADMASDLRTKQNKILAEAVNECGANRIILCRCDSHHAIEYGHALGISLFQGRYADKVINPNSAITN